jgi:dTDP-glucose pyrophosphorylase
VLKEIDHENGTQQAGLETISAHKMSDHSMKRTYFPGITDIVVVTDPASEARLRIHLGSRPHTVAKAETTGYARAFHRAFDLQQRCRLR